MAGRCAYLGTSLCQPVGRVKPLRRLHEFIGSLPQHRQSALGCATPFAPPGGDYIEGAEDETRLSRNRQAFDDVTLTPRYLVDVSALTLSRSLWGRLWSMPLGMAPTAWLVLRAMVPI